MDKPQVDAKRTVAATRTDEAWPENGYTTPGAVFVDKEGVYGSLLLFACPGCGRMGSIPATHPKNLDGWDITGGNRLEPESLTLHPSINCVGCCKWHGWLKSGVFKSC